MRRVIGEYESLEAAKRAVRALQAKISTQSIVIEDQRDRRWRRRDLLRDRLLDNPMSANFAVSMSGTLPNIEQARALLHAPDIKALGLV
jgi:rRNA processing protein Krr1/Pno1